MDFLLEMSNLSNASKLEYNKLDNDEIYKENQEEMVNL